MSGKKRDIVVGDTASFSKTLTKEELLRLCAAETTSSGKTAVRGTHLASIVSAAIAEVLAGSGAVCLSQQLRILRTVLLGDTVTTEVKISEKTEQGHVRLTVVCMNQRQEIVAEGESIVTV